MVQYSVGLSIADLQQRAFGVRRKHPGLEEHAHGEPSTGTGSKEARGGGGRGESEGDARSLAATQMGRLPRRLADNC